MTMEATGAAPERTTVDCENDGWPRISTRVAVIAVLRNYGVTMGWRLKGLGAKRFGLWLVHRCHQGGGASS
jgi:hypothetical protein